jgi:hypothetical protein
MQFQPKPGVAHCAVYAAHSGMDGIKTKPMLQAGLPFRKSVGGGFGIGYA